MNPQRFQVLGVQIEIMLADGTHPDEFEIAFDDIDQHRQFVDPVFTDNASARTDPEIVFEFAALVQPVVGVDVLLHIFGVGVHGTKFIDRDLFGFLTDTRHAEQDALARRRFGQAWVGRRVALGNDDGFVRVFLHVHNRETLINEASHDLGLGDVDGKLQHPADLPKAFEFGKYSPEKKVQRVVQRNEGRRKPVFQFIFDIFGGNDPERKEMIFFEGFMGLFKHEIGVVFPQQDLI